MTTKPASSAPSNRLGGGQVNWILLLVIGALAALLGIFLLFQSTSAARIFIEGMGIYWMIAGLVELLGLLGDQAAPMRLPRLIGAIAAVLSGGLILLSMILGTVIVPTLMRLIVAFTAVIMGVINIVVGSNRAAPACGRQILGIVYALLGIVLLVDPAAVPTFLIPIIGLLFIAAGGYAVYLAITGRQAGSVAVPGVPVSPESQKQALLNKAQKDVEKASQQAKNTAVGPNDGS